MRLIAALVCGCVLAVLAGCGEGYGPDLVTVPDVISLEATAAVDEIQSVGELVATYAEEPTDPSLCTVTAQDEHGEVPPDTEVVLTLTCKVEVPDVIGLPADDAMSDIEAVALTAIFDPEPEDPGLCEVTDQDETGEVGPGTEVLLTLSCQVDIPDVIGEQADVAQGEIEEAGDVTASFDLVPLDASLCSVIDQSDVGPVEEGTDIELTVECEEELPPDECHPSYPDQCLDPYAEDYDCKGGSGNGPEYVTGPLTVDGEDPFDLDRDGNGVGCE